MSNNIEELIQKISQKTGLSRAEIKQKIEEKKEELGYLINDIAATHIIAKDLNVSLELPTLKKKTKVTVRSLKKLEPGLSGISLSGIILRVYRPVEFIKEGGKGILAPILFHDGTESIRTILWGTKARHITEKKVERGSTIKLRRAYTKLGRQEEMELHLGDRGELEVDTEISTQDLPNPDDEILNLDVIDEEMREIDTKGIIHKVGNLVTFNRADGTEGRVANLFLKGDRTIKRMVFWDDQAEQAFNYTRGDELFIQGANVRINREGNPEIHTSRTTYILKIGHQTLPSLDEPVRTETEAIEVVSKKIAEITPDENLITLIARKGPESDVVHFSRKDGSTGSVKRAVIFDDTSETTLVLWDDAIARFDEIKDEAFQVNKLRVNMSRYNTIELHSVTGTEFKPLETSQISQEPPIRNIEDLQSHQGLASVQGVVQQVSEVREFNRADGSTGRVASMEIQDTTGSCRIVAWDDNVEKLNTIREKDLKYAKIFFGQMRQTDDESVEIHLSPQSHVRPSSRIPVSLRNIEIKAVEEVAQQPPLDYQKTHLSDLADDEDGVPVEILGKVIRLFQQSPYYMACPECRKKVVETGEGWECETHQTVEPNITMKLSGLIDDGTGTVKATFFGRSGEKMTGLRGRDIQQMLEHDLTDDEIFTAVQKEAEGKTILIQGRLQLQTREIEGETMQSQTLFANRVIFPNPKALSEELISQLSQE